MVFFNMGNLYDNHRIGKELAKLYLAGVVTGNEVQKAAIERRGKIWDTARENAFVLGTPRTEVNVTCVYCNSEIKDVAKPLVPGVPDTCPNCGGWL
jgi:hypothetical protein